MSNNNLYQLIRDNTQNNTWSATQKSILMKHEKILLTGLRTSNNLMCNHISAAIDKILRKD